MIIKDLHCGEAFWRLNITISSVEQQLFNNKLILDIALQGTVFIALLRELFYVRTHSNDSDVEWGPTLAILSVEICL